MGPFGLVNHSLAGAIAYGPPVRENAVWLVVALLVGLAIAVLPPNVSLPVLAIVILCVFSLIDRRVALVSLLVIAPFKALIDTEVPGTFDLGQIALLATVAIWIARDIASRHRLGIVWTPLYVPIALFTFAASISLWVSLSPAGTITELLKWIEMLVMIGLVMAMGRDYGPDWIAGAVIVSAVAQAILGIYQFNGGSGAPSLWILDFTHFRAFGSFGQPNPFGAFMGLTLPLALGTAFGAGTETWTRWTSLRVALIHTRDEVPPETWRDLRISAARCVVFTAAAAILGAGLYVSWSRGAWIGFIAAAGVMIFLAPPRRLIGLALIGALVGGSFLAVVTGITPASVVARISDFSAEFAGFNDVRGQVITNANYAVLERLAHWQAAIGMATDSPWLGVGFGDYAVAYPRFQLMNWRIPLGHAHNYYLNLWAETGIVGLVAYIAAWIAILALTLRALAQTSGFRRGIALGLLGTWTHLAVHSLFDNLYVNNLYLLIGVMLGLIGILLEAV